MRGTAKRGMWRLQVLRWLVFFKISLNGSGSWRAATIEPMACEKADLYLLRRGLPN